MLSVNTIGDENAGFNSTEKQIIQPALARTLERYSPENISAVSQYLDPIMIIVGVGMWGFRMRTILNSPQPKEKQKETQIKKVNSEPPKSKPAGTVRQVPIDKDKLNEWIGNV